MRRAVCTGSARRMFGINIVVLMASLGEKARRVRPPDR